MELKAQILRIETDPNTGEVTGAKAIDFQGNPLGSPITIEQAWAANEIADARAYYDDKGLFLIGENPATLPEMLEYLAHQGKATIVVMPYKLTWPEGERHSSKTAFNVVPKAVLIHR